MREEMRKRRREREKSMIKIGHCFLLVSSSPVMVIVLPCLGVSCSLYGLCA